MSFAACASEYFGKVHWKYCSQVEFLRAKGYDQLWEDEKEVLASGSCFNDVSHEQLPSYAIVNGFFLPTSAKFARVEHDRGASRGCSTAISAESRNNIVHWSKKICRASNQRAHRARIVVESFATKLSDDLVLNIRFQKVEKFYFNKFFCWHFIWVVERCMFWSTCYLPVKNKCSVRILLEPDAPWC